MCTKIPLGYIHTHIAQQSSWYILALPFDVGVGSPETLKWSGTLSELRPSDRYDLKYLCSRNNRTVNLMIHT